MQAGAACSLSLDPLNTEPSKPYLASFPSRVPFRVLITRITPLGGLVRPVKTLLTRAPGALKQACSLLNFCQAHSQTVNLQA